MTVLRQFVYLRNAQWKVSEGHRVLDDEADAKCVSLWLNVSRALVIGSRSEGLHIYLGLGRDVLFVSDRDDIEALQAVLPPTRVAVVVAEPEPRRRVVRRPRPEGVRFAQDLELTS